MKTHLIAYDLSAPHDDSSDYQRVIDGIKRLYPTFAHVEKSVFVVKSETDTTTVRDSIWRLLFATDRLFVAELAAWSWFNMKTPVHEWLAA